MGRLIFKNWRQRLGKNDEKEEVRVSFILGVDKNNPLHFKINITQSFDSLLAEFGNRKFVRISRSILSDFGSRKNLDNLTKFIADTGEFELAPVCETDQGPHPYLEHSIQKRKLYVTDAWKIDSQHEDAQSIAYPEKVLVPEGVTDLPIDDLQAVLRHLRSQKSS